VLNKLSTTPWGSGFIDPHFFDLSTSWRTVVSFTPQPLYFLERALGTHWIGGWVDPRAGWSGWHEENKILDLTRTWILAPCLFQSVASHYTDYRISTPFNKAVKPKSLSDCLSVWKSGVYKGKAEVGKRVSFTVSLISIWKNNVPADGGICPHWFMFLIFYLLQVCFYSGIPLILVPQLYSHHV
jgi:hypothetical protein